MPYIEYLFCEKCGNYARLDIDHGLTIDAYNKENRKSSIIDQSTIVWDYLIYSCDRCGTSYRYTYRDVERRVREYFSLLSKEFKEHIDVAVGRAELRENIGNSQDTTSKRILGMYKPNK